jgi:hypothetical protein
MSTPLTYRIILPQKVQVDDLEDLVKLSNRPRVRQTATRGPIKSYPSQTPAGSGTELRLRFQNQCYRAFCALDQSIPSGSQRGPSYAQTTCRPDVGPGPPLEPSRKRPRPSSDSLEQAGPPPPPSLKLRKVRLTSRRPRSPTPEIMVIPDVGLLGRRAGVPAAESQIQQTFKALAYLVSEWV